MVLVLFRRIQEDEPTDEDDVAENDDNNDEDEDEDDLEDEYERFAFSLRCSLYYQSLGWSRANFRLLREVGLTHPILITTLCLSFNLRVMESLLERLGL